MLRYIIKRIIFAIPVLIGATFLVFTIMDLAPGDPARIIPVSYTHLDVYKRQGISGRDTGCSGL